MTGKPGRTGQKVARTERLYDEIRYRRSQGESYKTIAAALFIGHGTVERVVREIGLPTGQQPKLVAPSYNTDHPWTPDDEQALRLKWATGDSSSKIAAQMGRTKSGIIGKSRRMGLPGRPSPLGIGRTKTIAAPQSADAVVIVRVRAPAPKQKRAPEPPAFAEARIPHVPATPPFATLGKSPCQFPMWSHSDRPVIRDGKPWICDKPAIMGRSWCPDCWGIVYQSRAPRLAQIAAQSMKLTSQ